MSMFYSFLNTDERQCHSQVYNSYELAVNTLYFLFLFICLIIKKKWIGLQQPSRMFKSLMPNGGN